MSYSERDSMNIIGIRIRTLREMAGLTQAEVAHETGVSELTVRRWEQGRAALTLLDTAAFARALGRRPEDVAGELLGG